MKRRVMKIMNLEKRKQRLQKQKAVWEEEKNILIDEI